MDNSASLDAWLAWFNYNQLLHSHVMLAYIGLMAVVPVLIALIMRDRIAVLWTGLFSLGIVSLGATKEINWTILATFEATAAFCLAFAAVIRQQRYGLAREEELQELRGLNTRLNILEACEQRRVMQSLNRPFNTRDMTGLMAASEESHTSGTQFPIAPEHNITGHDGARLRSAHR